MIVSIELATADDVDGLSEIYLAKNQGAANAGKILAVGTDGNLVLVNIPEGGASGDVVGVLDESNNILLSGDLADGTYILSFVDEEGNITGAGTLEVNAIPETVEPVTVDIELTDGIRVGSDGTDRTMNGYCATPYIDLTNIPKPCTINLTGAKWAYSTASETGPIMYYAKKPDETKIAGGYTNDTIGAGYFTLVRNGDSNVNVTVTVTSDDVGYIRFSGNWSNSEVENANFDTMTTPKATLTYTPLA